MAKKTEKNSNKSKSVVSTNNATIELIERQVKNFLIRTKNEEERVDRVLEAVSSFKNMFSQKVGEMLEELGLKIGEEIPEDRIEEVNTKYRELYFNLFEIESESFRQFTEAEFNQSVEGLTLAYSELKVLKNFLIKTDN